MLGGRAGGGRAPGGENFFQREREKFLSVFGLFAGGGGEAGGPFERGGRVARSLAGMVSSAPPVPWPGSDSQPRPCLNDPLVFRWKMRYVGWAGGGRAGPRRRKFFRREREKFLSVWGRRGAGPLVDRGRGGPLRGRLPPSWRRWSSKAVSTPWHVPAPSPRRRPAVERAGPRFAKFFPARARKVFAF